MSASSPFRSFLEPAISAWLALREALGRGTRTETCVLADLDRFLAAREAASLSAEGFDAWALTLGRLAPVTRRNYMRIVRNLCLYRRRTSPHCFVPAPDLFPACSPPQPPFIFSEDQILSLLEAAGQLSATTLSPLQPQVYRLTVTLAYTAGLRRRELVRLTIGCFDPALRTLRIEKSKFHKSRLIALSDDAAREMQHYLAARRQLPHPAEAPLLANRQGDCQAYSGDGLADGFQRLCRAAGIRDAAGRAPRLHDLRHTHAVHALLRWYRDDSDPQAKLPILAAAMGHVSVVSTAYYLPFLEPLAQAASRRFARHARRVLGGPGPGGDRG